MRISKNRLFAVLVCGLCIGNLQAVSVMERAGNPFRTAANNQETILNKTNVASNRFGFLWSLDVDAKVETQPLVLSQGAGADDLIIITTMKNDVIGVNARTHKPVYQVKLGTEIKLNDSDGPHNMDMWKHTPTWGISATPIIDPASNTLFIASWQPKNGNNLFRDYWIYALDPRTGNKKAPPVRIFGQSQEGNGCWFNDADAVFNENNQTQQYVYPKLRAGLALTKNNGLVLAFAANGESAQVGRKNPHGFVLAYDTRGLLAKNGFSKDAAMFCASAFNSWGAGIWQAGGAPAIDEHDNIYVATSNGTSNNGDIDLAESMIKLQFTPSSNGSRPVLTKLDFYKAFMDEAKSGADCLWKDNNSEVSCGRGPVGSAAADWDFGASGPLLVPDSDLILQGTKDGILYSLDRNNLGKNDRFIHLLSQPPLVASYFGGNTAENWNRAQHLNLSLPCPAINNGDHGWFVPCGSPENNKMHHIHALSYAQHDPGSGIVFVWGENSSLKAYDVSPVRGHLPVFRAQADDVASLGVDSPGGMPGGLLMLSGAPSQVSNAQHAIDYNTAIIWAVFAKFGDANKDFAEGQLVAYDASSFQQNKLTRLFRTGDDQHGGLGKMSRMIPPVVANGRVHVMVYRVTDLQNEPATKFPNCTALPGTRFKVCSQLQVFGLKS